ncbi:interferon-induced protein 44-like [Anarhichas minor]|uniref:interferon-induced protein 44-like n=1 Tax=Anarhichas minor TaxID=65739 RepID=UPI003F7419CF
MGRGPSKPAPKPPAPPAPPYPYFSKPWRNVTDDYQENLAFVKSYQPRNQDVKHLRILLHGPVGSGKSSFFNSVDTALKGTVSGRAATDAISGSSFTKKYTAYKIRKDPDSFYSVIFNDIMGFEQNTETGVDVQDVKLAMRGHMPNGYKFNPIAQLQETDRDYISSPTLEDRVHVLVCVIPAGSVSLISEEVEKKLREVRQAATEMGIPQLAILTKVDEACPQAEEDLKETYRIKYLKEQVDKFSMLLGIPPNCIFLVKNYHSEIKTNDDINALILSALKQMITFGEDFLDNL